MPSRIAASGGMKPQAGVIATRPATAPEEAPTMVGASSGAVAGLVAITPACGFIPPLAAILLGIVAGALCALAVGLKYRFGYDDSLDVVGVHFVGGWIGSLWIGLFATPGVNAVVTHKSVFFGGSV